jgi:eukaryotic-like serine/threonine-protein kinase
MSHEAHGAAGAAHGAAGAAHGAAGAAHGAAGAAHEAAGAEEGNLPVTRRDGQRRSGDDLVPGALVGEHVVVGLLARGGCGSVYHATHRDHGGKVAVKVLHASLAVQPKMVERFFREVEVVSLLRHPNIVEIHEIGLLPDKRPFYVMEVLPGGTVDDLLRKRERLSTEEALFVLEPVCAALSAVHAAGVVHRDVKASNIAFTAGRRAVKLLDFGIAKLISPAPGYPGLTTVGRQLGTPTIMAPEQLLGGVVDARVDVYALGVLSYRLLTGRPPFRAESLAALARKHLEEPPPRPSRVAPLPPALDAIVLRCLEKRPEHRFDSARSFIKALAGALGRSAAGPESARPAPTPGIAIYVDLRVHTSDDDMDEALGSDIGYVLDLCEETLASEGFVLAQVTGSGILGVRPVSGDADELRRERRAAALTAARLHAALARRPTADLRVHANIALHADEVIVRRADKPEIVGGAILRTAAWAPRDEVPGVCATTAALEGIEAESVIAAPSPV